MAKLATVRVDTRAAGVAAVAAAVGPGGHAPLAGGIRRADYGRVLFCALGF